MHLAQPRPLPQLRGEGAGREGAGVGEGWGRGDAVLWDGVGEVGREGGPGVVGPGGVACVGSREACDVLCIMRMADNMSIL